MSNKMKDITIGFIAGATSVITAYALTKADYKTSNWECNWCDINFKPPFKEYFFAPHTIKKRKLICPVCGKHDYFECKRDWKKILPKKKKNKK